MASFSNDSKSEIIGLDIKEKKCCLFSFLYGFLFCSQSEGNNNYIKTTIVENANLLLRLCDFLFKKKHIFYYKDGKISIDTGILRYFTIAEYKKNLFKCDDCISYFLRGIFLASGSITDPEKSYLLELSFASQDKQMELKSFLNEVGFDFKSRERFGKYVLYTKNSEIIEDFMAKVGATSATFAIINSKITKEFRNNTNRVYNCDNANINKSLAASKKYIGAIEYLISSGKIDLLPDQLRETAFKRIEFKELNYSELGRKFNPTISKTGLFHRLEKIVSICEEFKKEEQ